MATAFVLINTEIDAMEKVLRAMKKISGVVEAYSLYGTYDVIARVEANSVDRLNETILDKIRRADGVRNTLTMIVVEKA